MVPDSRWPADGPTWSDLVRHYAEPHRHYHTLDHVRAVVQALPADASPALILAAWYHDVIYDSRANDNEQRSADFLRLAMPDSPHLESACRLILLTQTHQAADDDHEGHLLLDADLAILASTPALYDAYAEAIRREYDWVPEEAYRTGRAAVLERFLARPRIYHTAIMAPHESAARANLRREIEHLRG